MLKRLFIYLRTAFAVFLLVNGFDMNWIFFSRNFHVFSLFHRAMTVIKNFHSEAGEYFISSAFCLAKKILSNFEYALDGRLQSQFQNEYYPQTQRKTNFRANASDAKR